ncbi:dual specificity protein phosphatase family protein [Haloarcula sp. 1CSR25-25]|uniref:protein-tyrosine phosphatase family protein n=1 Tax=Haloarcula sp. 1CSR25-25 TaxID=2862545 RepID=UPI002895967A|nr:dual specificity protein phosphatase family protein [Haloarcula sp. 1CSR25-25]MDT3434588.1 dual specificity protein phosphatase family protein [Haloarcula sp. 1CSR25-25]
MPIVNPHRFAPAAADEEYVYGACAPGWHTAATHQDAIDDWIAYMQAHDIERVCCLLPGQQLDHTGANVQRYREAFGESAVRHAPVPDHQLIPEDRLRNDILPFLVVASEAEERVVVHCLAGIGRTGQVLAAWLVYHYDYGPDRAIETVQESGRDPEEAIRSGNATEAELSDLLSSVARL